MANENSSYDSTFSALRESAIYSAHYSPTLKEKHCILLSKDLHFYELDSSKIVFAIDLNGTILKGSTVPDTNDLRCSKVAQGYGVKCGPDPSSDDIEFGKFIYFEESATKRIFFLIKVFDKLILLERCFNGLKIMEQLDNVLKFSIVDPDNSFFPSVHISCRDSINKGLYFGKNETNNESGMTPLHLQNNEVVKGLLDKMKTSKAELAIQKSITKKEYFHLKTQLTLGPNIARGSSTVEKQILQKLGDIWMRIHNNKLVIGIPVTNNSNERFIPLQNIRVTLFCAENEITEFDYNIYHLKNVPFMQSKSSARTSEQEHREDNYEWFSKESRIIQPTCSAVIVLQMDQDTVMSTQSKKFLCLILYDIVIKDRKFQQQCPINDIVIEDDFLYNNNYHLKFEPKTLLQDLLVVTSTSFSKYFRIEFELERISLKSLLIEKLGYTSFEPTGETTVFDIDELAGCDGHYSVKTLCDHILLNKNNSSHLYGSLLIVCNCFDIAALKIYTRTEGNLYALMRDIYKLLPAECKIIPATCTSMQSKVQLLKFREALWNNITTVEKFCHQNKSKKRLKRSATFEFQQIKLAQELKTDILALKTL